MMFSPVKNHIAIERSLTTEPVDCATFFTIITTTTFTTTITG
ncbi:hypothetical protein [Echinicola strongylocentroti]|nr:hypothetical protein [Echinicola strongylocentroti]